MQSRKLIFQESRFGRQGSKDYRCPFCRRLLMRGRIVKIETRCPRCKRMVSIRE